MSNLMHGPPSSMSFPALVVETNLILAYWFARGVSALYWMKLSSTGPPPPTRWLLEIAPPWAPPVGLLQTPPIGLTLARLKLSDTRMLQLVNPNTVSDPCPPT